MDLTLRHARAHDFVSLKELGLMCTVGRDRRARRDQPDGRLGGPSLPEDEYGHIHTGSD